MDVKIGRRLYDDDATPEKTERMMRKSANSTSGTLGFRISGMRVFNLQISPKLMHT
jgi:1D-myo-inositol-tetrakisphosphate 5-kinase/inositol-polyphosphate multikinase